MDPSLKATKMSNYRSISILPAILRLFEKLITYQLCQYMDKNDFYSTDQSGFLRLHSTLTCILKNTNGCCRGLDLRKLMGLVFIDLRKVFDTVDQSILYRKLQHYGVRHHELSWLISYLFNRKQPCRVSGTDSKVNDLTLGVPERSCLGPILFLICINDLPLAIAKSNTSTYEINQLNETMNNDLYKLEK